MWRNEAIDIREPQQKAVIIHDGAWQDLILEVKFEGAPAEFGWIVPTPTPPEVTVSKAEIFVALSKGTQERRYYSSRRPYGLRQTAGGRGDPGRGPRGADLDPPGPPLSELG